MIFIDTGAFIARYIARDQHHARAVSFWETIGKKGTQCITSNFVLDESFTVLGRRAGYDFAAKRAVNIYGSERLTILRPEEKEEIEALSYFKKYADQRVSFTDCVSFALMKKNRIRDAFTFDGHFKLAGFRVYP